MSVWSLKNKSNLNFASLINRKCLKRISSVKTKKIINHFSKKEYKFWNLVLNIYTGLGYFIRATHISLIHKIWVALITKGSYRLTALGTSWKLQLLESNLVTWLLLLYCSVYLFELWIHCGSITRIFQLLLSFTEKKTL